MGPCEDRRGQGQKVFAKIDCSSISKCHSNEDIGNARRSRRLGSSAARSALAPNQVVGSRRFSSAQMPSICHLSRACNCHGVTYGPPLVHVPQHSPRRRRRFRGRGTRHVQPRRHRLTVRDIHEEELAHRNGVWLQLFIQPTELLQVQPFAVAMG